MKQILLIEDIASRQKSFLGEADVSLDSYSPKIDNRIGDRYLELFEQLKECDEIGIKELFDDYSCITVHWSAFESYKETIRYKLEKYCKEEEKPLIAFSGDHESDHYTVADGLKKLVLNSKTFYSKNLEFFLDNYDGNTPNILMLSYGKYWETSVYLNVLEKINLFIENNSTKKDIVFSTFKRIVKIEELDHVNYNYEAVLKIKDDWIYLDDISIFENKLKSKIRLMSDV